MVNDWKKTEREGEREREIELGEKKMREEFDGGTGRNDEHRGVNITGNQFYQ